MGFKDNMIGFLVLCSVIVAFTVMYSDLGSTYGKTISDSNNLSKNLSSVSYITNISSMANTSFSGMTNPSNGGVNTSANVNSVNNFNAFWVFLSTAWNGLMLIANFPIILVLFFNDLALSLGGLGIPGLMIPTWFMSLISAIVMISIVFLIIKFAKGDTSDL